MAGCDTSYTRFPIPGPTASCPHSSTLLARKSKFLTWSCQCGSPGEAKNFVTAARAAFPDATHHCWAYVAGPPGDSASIGFSDDGEPHGTAGRPMLKVLLHSGIGRICAVVTRWFGGIKLGTGGLARAYQDSVAENLKTLPLIELVNREHWRVTVDYAFLEALRRFLPTLDVMVEEENYGERPSLLLAVPDDRINEFHEGMAHISNGSVMLERAQAPGFMSGQMSGV